MEQGKAVVMILVGLPGSGKTHLVNRIKKDTSGSMVYSFSADDFFYDHEKKEYNFDPTKLPEAHSSCLRRYADLVQDSELVDECTRDGGIIVVVVDNTNTTVAEIAPYAALAMAHGWELKILICWAPTEVCVERNIHSVPAHVIGSMAERIRRLPAELPPWWNVETNVHWQDEVTDGE